MKILRKPRRQEHVKLQMSAMIDIVFLLLVFFVMTFQIVVPEGDFNLKMPPEGRGAVSAAVDQVPLHVYLSASSDGRLAGMRVGDRAVKDMDELRRLMIGMAAGGRAGDATDSLPEVEIHCDRRLDYRHLVDAMTAVKGYIGPDGRVVNLADSIKLAPSER